MAFATRVPTLAVTLGAMHALETAALHALDRSWVPFYCRQCDRSFCGEHWDLTPTFNWGLTIYSGTYPSGHPHVIEHC